MPKVTVFAGTTNGLYAFESDARRTKWKRRGPYLKGTSVNHFAYDPKSKTLYAATLDQGVMTSKTLGRSWTSLNDGLPIRKVWSVAVNPKDSNQLWTGTHFSYLFRSNDRGRTWSLAEGYLQAPGKEQRWGDWAMGTIGNSLHGIHFDPADPKRMIVVSSTNHGVVRTADGGETWEYARNGVFESCPAAAQSSLEKPPDEQAQTVKEHLDSVHACTHRVGIVQSSPNVVYRQMHCGVYRSDDFGSTWRDISAGLPERHGFPLAVHAKDTQTAFVVPAYQGKCERHNSCIIGALDVYRTRSGGRSWEKLSDGLPRDVHCVVLRHGMDIDRLQTPGVYFGTTTGDVFASPDSGDRWMRLATKLPRVQGITAVTV
ncbi:MAG: WD40/YVTN/BNR-like repeat-containing protein [bacterium]